MLDCFCRNVVDVTAPQLENAAIDTAETLLRFNQLEIQRDEKRAVVLAHEKRIKQMADLQEQVGAREYGRPLSEEDRLPSCLLDAFIDLPGCLIASAGKAGSARGPHTDTV